MPIHIYTSGGWNQLNTTSDTASEDVYVRVASGTGSINRRVESVYVRTATGWVEVHKAYVVQPPTAPSTPTISSGANFNSNVYYLSVSWGTSTPSSGSTIIGYTLERKDSFGNVTTYDYGSSSRDSGLISINPGSSYKFRVKATASNSAGTADSAWSNVLEARAGQPNSAFSINGVSNFLFTKTATGSCVGVGDYYSITKTGSSADPAVPGYVNVTRAVYQLNTMSTSVSIASQTRSLICAGPYIYQPLQYPTYGTNTPVTIDPASYSVPGGGTYYIQAVGTTSGNGWPSHDPNTCTLNSSALVKGNLTISGVQTTSNSVINTNGTW